MNLHQYLSVIYGIILTCACGNGTDSLSRNPDEAGDGASCAGIRAEHPEPGSWIMQGGDERILKADFISGTGCRAIASVAFVSDTSLMGKADTVLIESRRFRLRANRKKRIVFKANLEPGFYQARISAGPADGAIVPLDSINIGIEPELIVSPRSARPDFDDFWKSSLDSLSGIAMDCKLRLMPEYSSARRNIYEVEFKSFGGATMGGIYAEPVQPGKYPVIIDFMGYGAEPFYYRGDDNPEVIQFLVSIRNQGIFKDEGYWILRGLDSKENFYYRGAYCDVVRAVDFICSREKADTSRIVSTGESQGGALCWISASLDHRVKAIAPSVPFMSDFEDYGDIVYWPVHEILEEADRLEIPHSEIYDLLSYFDIKNFTSEVRCPVLMAFGLQDPTCPPHTNFAGYNMVRSPKEWYCSPERGHNMWQDETWKSLREEFLRKYLEAGNETTNTTKQ